MYIGGVIKVSRLATWLGTPFTKNQNRILNLDDGVVETKFLTHHAMKKRSQSLILLQWDKSAKSFYIKPQEMMTIRGRKVEKKKRIRRRKRPWAAGKPASGNML